RDPPGPRVETNNIALPGRAARGACAEVGRRCSEATPLSGYLDVGGGTVNLSADAGYACSRSYSSFAATIASTRSPAAVEMPVLSFWRRPVRARAGVLANESSAVLT